MAPSVSVITPMKNASAFVGQTVDSVRSQLYSDWELIVVDDGSTDKGKSVSIIEKFMAQDSRIRLVKLPVSKGSSGARNEGMKAATGRYYAFLDCDDIWHPDYLSTMMKNISLCSVQNAALYYCGYRRMNDDCSETILPDYKAVGVKKYGDLLCHCPLFPSITILDSTKLDKEVIFTEKLKSLRDDYVFWLDVLNQGYVAVGYGDILVDYRMHKNSLTASKRKMIKPQWKVYRETLGFNVVKSAYYMCHWGLNGLVKYHGKKK